MSDKWAEFINLFQNDSKDMGKNSVMNSLNVLMQTNRNKPFIKRILDPNVYPVLNNSDGSISTHSMAWSGMDDGAIAYPTVMMNEQNKLQRYPPREAINRAINTNNLISFPGSEEASWFTRNYKNVWNK